MPEEWVDRLLIRHLRPEGLKTAKEGLFMQNYIIHCMQCMQSKFS